jgi:hypothetical protein
MVNKISNVPVPNRHNLYTNVGTPKKSYTRLMQQYGPTRPANIHVNNSPLNTSSSRYRRIKTK